MSNVTGYGRRPVKPLDDQPDRYFGKYRGFVRATNDPTMTGRVRCQVPYPFGDILLDWAMPAFPPGQFTPPQLGACVWVEFEQGNPNMPVYTGQWFRPGESPFQHTSAELQQNDEEANTTPTDDATHAGYHDHKSAWYSPHVRAWVSPSGHHILFDDFQSASGQPSGMVEIADRNGRTIRMHEAGMVDVFLTSDCWIRLQDNGTITIHGKTITANCTTLTATCSDTMTVNAPHVYLGGSSGAKRVLTETDGQSLTQAIQSLSSSLVSHAHSGVQTGPGTSGPPVGLSPVTFTPSLSTNTRVL